jgi:hypothetical protein
MQFVSDLRDVWSTHGRATMIHSAEKNPDAFFMTCSRILPKDVAISIEQQFTGGSYSPTTLRTSRQKMLLREAKSRIAARGVRAARATPPTPQVVRPGTSDPLQRDESEYAHLERQYRGKNLTAKEAAQLVIHR